MKKKSTTSKYLHRCAVKAGLLSVLVSMQACKPEQPAINAPSIPETAATVQSVAQPVPVSEPSWKPVMSSTPNNRATKSQLPDRFQRYGASVLGEGLSCVTGITTDEDGMNQQPVVALENTSGSVEWAEQLDGIEGTYQARATHCVQGGDALYVLMQSDTQSAQALSQTLLSIARLDMKGQVQATHAIDIADVHGQAYSAWVEDRPAAFRWEGGKLMIDGQYFLMESPNDRKPFTATIDVK